jgi:hypothetical protein
MAGYSIQGYDGSRTYVIAENFVDNNTVSLSLLGRGVSNYGLYAARNTIWHLENFAKATPPSFPLMGQFWYDKSTNYIKVYNGTEWKTPLELEGLNIDITAPGINDVLTYDGEKWVPGPGGGTGTGGTGDITAVNTSTGLTGGATTGDVTLSLDQTWLSGYIGTVSIGALVAGDGLSKTASTLNVGAGTGITVNANDVAVDTGWLQGYIGTTAGGTSTTPGSGDIESVTAGAGLTGGGLVGAVTLNVGEGDGISVTADAVSIDETWLSGYIGTTPATVSLDLNGLTDVVIATPTAGNVLFYTGTRWENGRISAGDGLEYDTTSPGGRPILNVGEGTGITVGTNLVSVNATWLSGFVNGYIGTYTGTTQISGITPSGGTLAVTGAISATGDITGFGTISDDRLKTSLGTIRNATEKLETLSGFYYEFNSAAHGLGYTQTEQQLGLSAQSVQKVFPEAIVPLPGGDYLGIRYEKLVPVLIESIKELSARVRELENKLL